jgi:hypothetical protein
MSVMTHMGVTWQIFLFDKNITGMHMAEALSPTKGASTKSKRCGKGAERGEANAGLMIMHEACP